MSIFIFIGYELFEEQSSRQMQSERQPLCSVRKIIFVPKLFTLSIPIRPMEYELLKEKEYLFPI